MPAFSDSAFTFSSDSNSLVEPPVKRPFFMVIKFNVIIIILKFFFFSFFPLFFFIFFSRFGINFVFNYNLKSKLLKNLKLLKILILYICTCECMRIWLECNQNRPASMASINLMCYYNKNYYQ